MRIECSCGCFRPYKFALNIIRRQKDFEQYDDGIGFNIDTTYNVSIGCECGDSISLAIKQDSAGKAIIENETIPRIDAKELLQ